MLKELIPPIKDRILFKKELASKNVICVRSSSPTLNCNVSFTVSPVRNEAPAISEPFIQSDKLTLPPLLLAAVEKKLTLREKKEKKLTLVIQKDQN
ncbi:uncharacterized protein LOC124814834 isoform X3 [Hydra vulgaris]|uniref:Uncharacterized protein LOC124814834 isoform X3 n=1 Tax=Hydra vulgaris TaxID=6087 RepID=A0ABM4C0G5_HYDVU